MKVKLTERDIREAVRRSLSVQMVIREGTDRGDRFGSEKDKIVRLSVSLQSGAEEVYIKKSNGQDVILERTSDGDYLQTNKAIFASEEGVDVRTVLARTRDESDLLDKVKPGAPGGEPNVKLLGVLARYTPLNAVADAFQESDILNRNYIDFDARPPDERGESTPKGAQMIKKIRIEMASGARITAIKPIFDAVTVAGWVAGALQKGLGVGDTPAMTGFSSSQITSDLRTIVPQKAETK
jgi:uncharacterized protein YheU (UPF0270 family)